MDYHALVNTFSPKEFDIFCLLAKGLTAHKIADELYLGYKTVANYGTQIKNKFNATTVTELAHIAATLGIIKKSWPIIISASAYKIGCRKKIL